MRRKTDRTRQDKDRLHRMTMTVLVMVMITKVPGTYEMNIFCQACQTSRMAC